MNHARLVSLAATFALMACTAPQPGTPLWMAEQQQKRQDARVETVKAAVEDLPSWFTTPPTSDTAIYVPGTSISSDLQFAEDKAVLAAKRAMADRVNSRISGKMKEFLSESGTGENNHVLAESERVTSNLITEVNLAGYSITEKKFVPVGSQYRAYVLLQYPLGNTNALRTDQLNQDGLQQSKLRAAKAYQELEDEIKKAQTEDNAPASPLVPVDKKDLPAN